MSRKESYDVIIIGAGPAGCATALALRKENLSVALLDKKIFPRDKVCGDAIPYPAIKVLQEILAGEDHKIEMFKDIHLITSARIYTDKGKSIRLNWNKKAYNSPRISFDDHLVQLVFQYTKTTFITEEVKDLEFYDDHVSVRTKENIITGKIIIGCDGAHSITRKHVSSKRQNPLGTAIRSYYKGVLCEPNCNEFFLLDEELAGYFWIFPLANNVFNVGIGLSPLSHTKTDLKDFFERTILHHPVIKERFKNAEVQSPITGFRLPFGGSNEAIVNDRLMLTGDAANLIDPLQGHGIHTAMHSGMYAAQQVIHCFQTNDFSKKSLQRYEQKIQATIGKEHKRNIRIMKQLYYKPWLTDLAVALAKNKMVKNMLQKMF